MHAEIKSCDKEEAWRTLEYAQYAEEIDHDGLRRAPDSGSVKKLRLECLDLEPGNVIKQCRNRVLSQHLIHHSRTISRARAGMPVVLDTLSKEFSTPGIEPQQQWA
ncbi:hypothetical protein [Pseudomonas sp. DWP3-1-2]|uniref:hypothetical protein n=1 Tax=Pseudomonas sp. DWP3-1-2 TaxID=2804645 RepID=UPI003CF69C52